jgi:arylsulfatase A-like enzyme
MKTLKPCLALFFFGLFSTTSAVGQTNILRIPDESQKMPPPAPRKPSIVLILADNIGYGDLGRYGQAKIKTPNLDRLAKEGIRFTDFYTGSPEDVAARASLFTGMEPRHLHTDFNQALPAKATTLAEFLKQSGYRTGLIGEWNLGDTEPAMPDKKGFDEFAGFLNASHARDYFTPRIWRLPAPPDTGGQMYFPENESGKRGRFMPDLMVQTAENFIRISKPELLNHYRPFFLCVAFPIPHVSASGAPPGGSEYGDSPWPPLERIRATLISRMDEGIGKLMDKLAEMKINTNTIVIFTSVGGPKNEKGISPEFFNSAGSLRGMQGSVYEGGIRVPLIIRWPAQIRPEQTSDQVCAVWDLFPTLAEAAYAKLPEKLDGVSLMPTLLGKPQKNSPSLLLWESNEEDSKLAARMGEWKIVRTNSTAAFELYDLRTDPGEKNNLAEKKSAELKKIEKALQAEGILNPSPKPGETNKAAGGF